MIVEEEKYLAHYGILRKSGRYPWGSGSTTPARSRSFRDEVDKLRKEGMTDPEIARAFGMTTTEFRATASIAKNEIIRDQIAQVVKLKEKGYSNVAIGKRLDMPEATVRDRLKAHLQDKADVLESTSNMLKQQVAEKKFIDVGAGVENNLGISKDKLATAVARLKSEGYETHSIDVEQVGTGKMTKYKVLCPPGTTQKEVWQNRYDIQTIHDRSKDGGRSYLGLVDPISISSKRLAIRYKEDGGENSDGVVYVRPGKEDISLGGARYAQVRITVDRTHFIKGMAMYKDDLPDGVDLMFNTNKAKSEIGTNKLDALKPLKRDKATGEIEKDNPYGAVISKQLPKLDRHGREIDGTVRSAMNIVNEEGDWSKWSPSLSSQMLSKQSPGLAKQQLGIAKERREQELREISALTNPAVKKKLLEAYADGADSAAEHLKAAALPRQRNQVLLPIESMKSTEVYAPNFRNGERVALVRFPHGGTFEIPELTVNNKHPEANRLLGGDKVKGPAQDAIGIHPDVAKRLSGADFDGDTVLVIPNGSGQVHTKAGLRALRDFDPMTYKLPDDVPRMKPKTKGIEMGKVSNLITDMTLRGATDDEIAHAVKHSMVVIDAEKHHLDYKRSAIDNGIPALQAKYQAVYRDTGKAGAATLISKRKSEKDVPDRRARRASEGGAIDPITGEKRFVETGTTYTRTKTNKRTGEVTTAVVPKTTKVRLLAEVKDAHTLSSGTKMEALYADHSNAMKDLANKARLEYLATKPLPYSKTAKQVYGKEVASLNLKLNAALKNAPFERQAQLVANAIVSMKRKADPEMDAPTLKKIKAQALNEARNRTGAGKSRIKITDEEWEAIQHGAITNNKLEAILNNADLERVRELATPRIHVGLSNALAARAKAMIASGATQADIADALGVSVSTISDVLK